MFFFAAINYRLLSSCADISRRSCDICTTMEQHWKDAGNWILSWRYTTVESLDNVFILVVEIWQIQDDFGFDGQLN